MSTDAYEELRRWRLNMPDKHNGAYRRTWGKAIKKKSMRAAVNAKCQDCMCWQQAEVKECTIITCSLWQYRPNQSKGKEREKAVLKIARQIIGDEDSLFAKTPVEAIS